MKKLAVCLLLLNLCGCLGVSKWNYNYQDNQTQIQLERNKNQLFAFYLLYKIKMVELNLQREKNGLKPEPVMSESEWETIRNMVGKIY